MNNPYFGLVIQKYGKWKIYAKDRLLVFSSDKVYYYPIPTDKTFKEKFVTNRKTLKSLISKDSQINSNDVQDVLNKCSFSENDKSNLVKEKAFIPFVDFAMEKIKEEEDEIRILIYNKSEDKKDGWECIINKAELELIRQIKQKVEKSKTKNDKEDNQGGHKAPDENQNNRTTAQNNQFTNYKFLLSLERLYQILWTEYYRERNNSSKKISKLVELELSIKIVLNEFTKYCERLVQVILSYLKQDTLERNNKTKILPILFPSLIKSAECDQYLIYHLFGVTITMSWNCITYNDKSNFHGDNSSMQINTQITGIRKESKGANSSINMNGMNQRGNNDIDEDTKILNGTWGYLKAIFKQMDYNQNSAPDNTKDKKELRVPLTCLIDYCGFRFLCEYDFGGKSRSNESQKMETKRDIEECKPDFYQKCETLFYELFFYSPKKEGTFQKPDELDPLNRDYNDMNKNGQVQNKTNYDKLFDIVNDYFSKPDANGENNELKSSPNKYIFFRQRKTDVQQNKGEQMFQIEYFNMCYGEFGNLNEYQRQGALDDNKTLFFNKKSYFRPELLTLSSGKDNNFEQNYNYRSDKENMDNNKNIPQNQSKIQTIFKEKYLNIFNNSLNSFYFKIYDSETMDNLFHSHGINLISLGYIAEKSDSPYIREFCINEMIARTCKKIIFHILAEDRMIHFLAGVEKNNTCPEFPSFTKELLPYEYQKLFNKHGEKEDKQTNWSYFQHLKEMEYLNSGSTGMEQYKFYFGIWGVNQGNQQKNNDETIRNEILNINSNDEKKNQKVVGDNEGHNQNKKSTTIIADDHLKRAKELIAKFLNVLFNKTKDKIKIKGRYMNHKELWHFIKNEIAAYYEIESKEILIFCKLNCMSLPPFLDAFEYHTGIKLNWGTVKEEKVEVEKVEKIKKIKINDSHQDNSSQNKELKIKDFYPENTTLNYTNRYLLSITWQPDDVLEINPKTKTFSFSFFYSNSKEKNEEYISNYSQLIVNINVKQVESLDKFMLMRFFYERITKSNNFTLWYVAYFNELKCSDELDMENENKDLKIEQDKGTRNDTVPNDEEKINKNSVYNKNIECTELYKEIFDKLKNDNSVKDDRYDLTGLVSLDINDNNDMNNCSKYMKKKFSRLSYIMINLSKEIQNLLEQKIPENNDQRDPTKMKKNIIENLKETQLTIDSPFKSETQALELIENFYIKAHPYYSDIKELCGKELLKKWKANFKNREELEQLIENYFKDAIGCGLKCLPMTNIYLANIAIDAGTFYAVRNDFLNAVKIFNWAYLPFKNNSQYFWKDYNMYLKRFVKYNIKLGDFRTALALGDELIKENQSLRTEKDSKTNEFLNKNLHLERVTYNLALIALKVNDYEKGIYYCQTIFGNKDYNTNQISNINGDNTQNSNSVKKEKKTEYINWREGRKGFYPGKDLNREDKDYEKNVKDEEYRLKLKLYMKMIIRSLGVDNKKEYLQAILRFYDSTEEKQSIKEENPTLDEIKTALEGKGNLNEYFKGKILSAIKIKNRSDDSNTTDKSQIKEKEQNSDYDTFKKLFCFFENDNVFYSFNRAKRRGKKKKNDYYDNDNEREEINNELFDGDDDDYDENNKNA